MAILRNPILAEISICLSPDHGTLLPAQRHRGRASHLHRLQDTTRPPGALDPDGVHGMLRARTSLLPAAIAINNILGLEHAGRSASDAGAGHELRGGGDIHHQLGAAQLPGIGGQPAGDGAEPDERHLHEHQRQHRRARRRAARRVHRARRHARHLVVRLRGRHDGGRDYRVAGPDSQGRGEGACAVDLSLLWVRETDGFSHEAGGDSSGTVVRCLFLWMTTRLIAKTWSDYFLGLTIGGVFLSYKGGLG